MRTKPGYNYDGITSIVILMLFAIAIISLSSCRTSQISGEAVINFKPDYDNDLIDAEVVQHGDTLFYYDMDPRDVRELLKENRDHSVTICYKEKE